MPYNDNEEVILVSGMPDESDLFVAAVGADGKPVNPKRVQIQKRAKASNLGLRTAPLILLAPAGITGVLSDNPQKALTASGMRVDVVTTSGILFVTQVVIDGETIELSKATGTTTGAGASVVSGTAAHGQEGGELMIEFGKPIELTRSSVVEISWTNPGAATIYATFTLTNEGPIPGVARFS